MLLQPFDAMVRMVLMKERMYAHDKKSEDKSKSFDVDKPTMMRIEVVK